MFQDMSSPPSLGVNVVAATMRPCCCWPAQVPAKAPPLLCSATACCALLAYHPPLLSLLPPPWPGGRLRDKSKDCPIHSPLPSERREEPHLPGLDGEAQREAQRQSSLSPSFPACLLFPLLSWLFLSLVFLFLLSHSHVTFSVSADTSCSHSAVVSQVCVCVSVHACGCRYAFKCGYVRASTRGARRAELVCPNW